MGFWSRIFNSDSEGSTTRVRVKTSDNSKVRGDKFGHTDKSGGHTHRSYDLDTSTGRYREYGGGEKSDDRHYNK